MRSLRDIAADFALGPTDQKAPSSAGPDYSQPAPVIGGIPSGHRFTGAAARRFLEAYAGRTDAIDWVMVALNLITQKASHADFHFQDPTSLQEYDARRAPSTPKNSRVAPQDLTDLMEAPNPWTNYTQFIGLVVIDYLLTGDSFWLKYNVDGDGKPLALYRLHPGFVEVVSNEKTGLIDHYKYNPPNAEAQEFKSTEIIHFRRLNPHSNLRGAGVISGGPRTFDMEIALAETKAQYFQQGARLSGVLSTDHNVNQPIIDKIRRQFMGLYGGARNSYQVAVLERGLKFTPIQNSATDAQFGPLSDSSRDRILALFRVPPELVGIFGAGDRGGGAVTAAQRIFDDETMRPMLDEIQDQLSDQLVNAWGLDYVIEYEYVMPLEDRYNLAGTFASVPGVKVNEVRKLLDLELLPDSDPRGEVLLNMPGDNTNTSNVKDRPLPGEPGRPPDPQNTAAFPEPGQKPPADAAVAP